MICNPPESSYCGNCPICWEGFMKCVFCNVPAEEVVANSRYWFCRQDKYPVTEGHILFITRRHEPRIDYVTAEEWADLLPLIKRAGIGRDFNIGINCGELAGQTIPHIHVHVFPRTEGDVENPRGGIRNFKPALVPYL